MPVLGIYFSIVLESEVGLDVGVVGGEVEDTVGDVKFTDGEEVGWYGPPCLWEMRWGRWGWWNGKGWCFYLLCLLLLLLLLLLEKGAEVAVPPCGRW